MVEHILAAEATPKDSISSASSFEVLSRRLRMYEPSLTTKLPEAIEPI
jgi:hypothetical protein